MGSKGRVFVAELLRFNLVGACTLLLGTTVFLGMIAVDFGYVPALVADYAAGILFSYYMNKKYTFRVQIERDVVPLLTTVISYAMTFLLNVLLLAIAVEVYGFNVVYAQIASMSLLAILNFLMFKFVIFGDRKRRKTAASRQEG